MVIPEKIIEEEKKPGPVLTMATTLTDPTHVVGIATYKFYDAPPDLIYDRRGVVIMKRVGEADKLERVGGWLNGVVKFPNMDYYDDGDKFVCYMIEYVDRALKTFSAFFDDEVGAGDVALYQGIDKDGVPKWEFPLGLWYEGVIIVISPRHGDRNSPFDSQGEI